MVLIPVVQATLIFYALLLLVVWCTPIAFAAIEIGSFKSNLAYVVTNSGGKFWVFAITAITALVFAYRNNLNFNMVIKVVSSLAFCF